MLRCSKKKGGHEPHLINESVWAGVVVGEGFVNHQEHDAGEEGQGQDDQNGHLEGGQTLVSVCVPEQERRIASMWARLECVCVCVCVFVSCS